MSHIAKAGLRFSLLLFLIPAACLIFSTGPRQATEAEQARKVPTRGPVRKTAAPAASDSLQRHRNLGKAYYEQGKYPEAIEEFQKVIAAGKALALDHLDIGLALMQANKLDAALGELTTAKQMNPKLVAADYNLGIFYKRELRYPDAEGALKRVIEADPHDPAAWFNLGTVYFAQKELEQALDAHRHVLDIGFGRGQNFYVASLFHTFTILVRMRRQAEAQKILKVHEKMRDKVPGLSLQSPALEGGKYGAISVPVSPARTTTRGGPAKRVTLADISTRLGINLSPAAKAPSGGGAHPLVQPGFNPSIAVGDYDGDGRPDLYIVDPAGTNRLFHNHGDGTLTDVTEKAGVAGQGGSFAATFADYNNSGHPSLFVAGLNGITLYRNHGDGTFSDDTEKAGLKAKPFELDTRVLLFDADDDGFLDVVVTGYADFSQLRAMAQRKGGVDFPQDFAGVTSRFYRNNGDGTFTDLTETSGLASAKGRMRGAVFADFNNDGYADLLFFRDDGPPLLYLNQGEDKFVDRTAEAGEALSQSRAIAGEIADFDHDGNFDLVLWSSDSYRVLLNQGNAHFVAVTDLPALTAPRGLFDIHGTVVDLDGDGFDDLLNVDSNGKLHFIANRGGRFEERPLRFPATADEALAFIAPAWLSAPGKLDLLSFTRQGRFAAFEKEGPASRWVEVKLGGFKSNTQGVGTQVEFKAGNFYKKVVATGEPVRVFIGDLAKLDVVRVTWPNQIVQNAVDVATNKALEIRESERLASSCPLLYVWNGKRFVFWTDVLGVAPLGELASDGSRIKPYPEEFVRLPADLPTQDGRLVFQVTNELREVDYLDRVRLIAVDHPATEEIYSNEIYSSSPDPPSLFVVREKRIPKSAEDDHGHDVLPLIREADGRYPTDFRKHRIPGLADLHALTLELGDFPEARPIALWLRGWVFWTDSNASRALMSNSQMKLIPPYLQVRDERGQWVTVINDMGLPSGTNRTMRLDLTGKFLSRDHRVRIVTNLCVYWDQIFVSIDDAIIQRAGAGFGPASTLSSVEPPLISADLHYRGFSTPASDREHLSPDSFDYEKVLAEAPWNPMTGNYTRYGEVEKLLARADDHLVVMATGDEVTLKFDARALPTIRHGWKRDFFLYLCGWAKDGEPNTAFSKTIEPMPFLKMSNYPPSENDHRAETAEYQQYLREYQTRRSNRLIPPLAPVVR